VNETHRKHRVLKAAMPLMLVGSTSLAMSSALPVQAGHGSWHHEGHHGHSGNEHRWSAHASATQYVDFLYARGRVYTKSSGAIHGDETVICNASESCLSRTSLAVSHVGGHVHVIQAYLCGYDNDGDHVLPGDGVYQYSCSAYGTDFHQYEE
jgi:hypothetical protein